MTTPDYTKIIKASFELVKKNKWLWLFGALAGSTSGTNYNSFRSVFENNPGKNETFYTGLNNIPETGAEAMNEASDIFLQWVRSVPAEKWVLAVVSGVLLFIIIFAVLLVIQNWSKGALIKGIDDSLRGKKCELKTLSENGNLYLAELIRLSLIIAGFILASVILVPLSWILIYIIVQQNTFLSVIWVIAGAIEAVILFIGTIFISSFVSIYSQRLIVLNNMKAKEAFIAGVSASRKAFLTSLLMGAINFGIKMAAGIAEAVVAAIFIGVPAFLTIKTYDSNTAFSVILGGATAMSIIILVFFLSLVNAGMNVFTYANWNQLFNKYIENEKK